MWLNNDFNRFLCLGNQFETKRCFCKRQSVGDQVAHPYSARSDQFYRCCRVIRGPAYEVTTELPLRQSPRGSWVLLRWVLSGQKQNRSTPAHGVKCLLNGWGSPVQTMTRSARRPLLNFLMLAGTSSLAYIAISAPHCLAILSDSH